jgi:hypothetical protein
VNAPAPVCRRHTAANGFRDDFFMEQWYGVRV